MPAFTARELIQGAEDTESSGLAVAKAAKREGWIKVYEHAFGLDDLIHGLSERAGLLGIYWYT